MDESKKRTLTRDNSLLREFDESASTDMMVLYMHYKDHSFDCFNVSEYNEQMLRYIVSSSIMYPIGNTFITDGIVLAWV